MAKPAGYFTDKHDKKRPITGKQTIITDFIVRNENQARKQLLNRRSQKAERTRLVSQDYSEFERQLHDRFLYIVGSMYTRHPYAIQPSRVNVDNKTAARIVKENGKLTLTVHPYFLDLTKDQQSAVLKHEAIHIQYHRHDSNFRYHARIHKAPVYLADLFNIPYSVFNLQNDKTQVKIKDFQDYEEAMRFAKNYARDNHGKYHKLLLTQVMTPELKDRMKLFNF